MTNNLRITSTKWTDQSIIDLIRKVRNDLIKDFLDERYLKHYLSQQFNIQHLAAIKIEFIRTELKELLISPVNVAHYTSLIEQIRETDSASLAEGNEVLFYKEIELIIRKFVY